MWGFYVSAPQVKVNNMRIIIQHLVQACDRLAEFGPMKRPDQQGIDEVRESGAMEAASEHA